MPSKRRLDLEHPALVFRLTIYDGAVEPEPCVGDEDIHGAEALDSAGDERFAGGWVGDVCRDGECRFTELCRDALQAVLAAGGENDVASLPGEQVWRGLPDAAGGLGYDGRLAGQDSPLSASSCSRRMMWPLRRRAAGVQR